MTTDLERAYAALSAKNTPYKALFGYYDGDQPLLYTNKRLNEIFRGLDAVFTENWCALVIDSTKDRINLRGFSVSDETTQAVIDALIQANELLLESDDVHEAALVTGESFIIAWPNEDGQPAAYYNDPRLCHVFYQAENPRLIEFAAKWWNAADGTMRMTLYYPDRLEYYATTNKGESVSSAAAFRPMQEPTAPNPFSRVPVFHFRPQRRVIKSDLKSVIPLQNGINKLAADMMVVGEYGAFPQRYIISNADTAVLKNSPNEIWNIPAGDGMGQQTSVGQFSPADLGNYLSAIDNLTLTVSAITHTPKHYFTGQSGELSGEALIALESPLTKKAQDRIDRFSPVWRDLAAFLLEIAGITVKPDDITPIFDDPATIQPRTEAEITQIRVASGVPLVTALAREGWTDAEIEQLQADQQAAQKASQSTLAAALLDAERRFGQGNIQDGEE